MIVRIGGKRNATDEEKQTKRERYSSSTDKNLQWIDDNTVYEYVEVVVDTENPVIQVVHDSGEFDGETHEFDLNKMRKQTDNYVVDVKQFDYLPMNTALEMQSTNKEEIKQEVDRRLEKEFSFLPRRFNTKEITKHLYQKTALS